MTTLQLRGASSWTPNNQGDTRPHLAAVVGMRRWSRLDRYGRALARVVADALHGTVPSTTGLYVISQHSCFETNAAFHRELIEHGRASPLLFAYTLPGAAAAEVAAHFDLQGECLAFSGGSAAALAALLNAADALDESAMDSVLVAAADVLGPEIIAARAGSETIAEGAAALWLARVNPVVTSPRVCLEGALGPANPGKAQWLTIAEIALARARVDTRSIDRVYCASAIPVHENDATQALRTAMSCDALSRTLGNIGASLGLVAILSALHHPGVSLILAADSTASAAVVMTSE